MQSCYLLLCTVLSNENASNRGCRLPKKSFDRFNCAVYMKGDALQWLLYDIV